jgi:hypothetical protein
MINVQPFIGFLLQLAAVWLAYQVYVVLEPVPTLAFIWAFGIAIAFLLDFLYNVGAAIKRFQSQPDYEKSLRRASMGMAVVAITIWIMRIWAGSFTNLQRAFETQGWAYAVMFGIPLIYGLARSLVGMFESRFFPFWLMGCFLALLRIAVGVGLWIKLPPDAINRAIGWQSQLFFATWKGLAIWFLVVGSVRLFFVSGIPSVVMWAIAARIEGMKKRAEADPAFGTATFAVIKETRIRLRESGLDSNAKRPRRWVAYALIAVIGLGVVIFLA